MLCASCQLFPLAAMFESIVALFLGNRRTAALIVQNRRLCHWACIISVERRFFRRPAYVLDLLTLHLDCVSAMEYKAAFPANFTRAPSMRQ